MKQILAFKHSFILLLCIACCYVSVLAQTTIAKWTFETTQPITAGNFSPEIGSGFASGFHASPVAVYSSPNGNGSTHSFNSNNWSIGDYYQFQVATSGYSGISVSFDQTGSNTGPSNFKFQYSTNGTTFTDFNTYTVPVITANTAISWSAATANTQSTISVDLTSILAIESKNEVYFRIVNTSDIAINSGIVGATGTARLDNFTIIGTFLNYYNKQGSDISLLDSWTNQTDGSGTNFPTSFTASNVIFSLNNSNAFIGAPWTISGNNASFKIGTGASLVIKPTASLTVGTGVLVNFNNQSVTLQSDATGTAIIGNVAGTLSGATNVTVERFISAKKAYRFLSPGVTTTNSIHSNWQEGAVSKTDNPNPGFGTHISGAVIDQFNGFDATNTGAASLFTFNELTQSWGSGIANTNSLVLDAGMGYRLFVRGSRSVDLSSSSQIASATILRATGTLPSGNIIYGTGTVPALPNVVGNFGLLGNPFAAPVNWNSLVNDVSTSGISSTYYAWDAGINGANNRGGYASYNASGGGIVSPPTDPANTYNSSINNFIQPGQAVFIQTTNATPVVVFKESFKGNSTNLTAIFNEDNLLKNSQINMWLYKQNTMVDGVVLAFNKNFSAGIGKDDSYKFSNPFENFAISNKNQLLSIDGRQLKFTNDTILLYLNNLTATDYKLKFQMHNMSENVVAIVNDKLLNKQYLVPIKDALEFSFNATNQTAINSRFTIMVYQKNTANQSAFIDDGSSFKAVLQTTISSNEFSLNIANAGAFPTTVKLLNQNGQLIALKNLGIQFSGTTSISNSALPVGLYFIEVANGNNKVVLKAIKSIANF